MPHTFLIGLSLFLAAYAGLVCAVVSRERSRGRIATYVTLESEDTTPSRRAA
jgi:hypothetical protein